ncbi:hypothetical protein F511_39915 [Dorcoceras hygrometricum]|uniref:Uncharacterized protein n=1 Tax=Dorcoceras hygrometricum TaxID=472368 RepID=A0A2Z7C688_9LAMI|nr:hypothetical protein F511_39915 [Dorcoceras hygrometricum]
MTSSKRLICQASVIHNAYESVKYDDQTSGQLNQKGKASIGYIRPENSKPNRIKNRLEKDKVKAGSKSSVPNQSRRGSKKVKSVWGEQRGFSDLVDFQTWENLSFRGNIISGLISAPFNHLSEMASDLINNASQIYFDSVFGMEDEGMVKMFKNASVRDGKVVSTVQGKAVEISEELFPGTFELPTEGLTEMADVPKDLVFDARTAFSFDGQKLKTSCKKREIKFEFRLLNDILAKTVMVKAGSFDAVTHETRIS